MQIRVDTNIPEVQAALKRAAAQVPYALSTAINKTLEQARSDVRTEAARVFDRPTPWALNSVRVKYATKTNPDGWLAFKDKNQEENSRTMIEPHVHAGRRHYKAFEARLQRIGLLPQGWNAVPGGAAKLDSYGNMSQGQISQLLGVLGTYTESGFNRANINTVKRLAKGNVKKNVYGFVYWVNKVGSTKAGHLLPGVYQRVTTAFGSSLKPVLIFVKQAQYKRTLDFYGKATTSINRHFPGYFNEAFDKAIKTALLKDQGSLL
jgi:hypothetical protein